jgi:hypothetical protein
MRTDEASQRTDSRGHQRMTDFEDIAEQYELDRVVTAPAINFCAAIHLDGPLDGQTGYAINELGHQIQIAQPPRPSGPIALCEVTRLATDDQPAELRLVVSDLNDHGSGARR